MHPILDKFSITGWKRLLHIGIFILLLWELSHFWGKWQDGASSVFYYIHAPMHEIGHMVAQLVCSSETVILLAGSAFQLLTPISTGLYFICQGDCPALALCLGWLGFATAEMGIYMYDADRQTLTLVAPFTDASELEGDFTRLFRQWDCLQHSCRIGEITVAIGYGLVFTALAMILAMLALGLCRKKLQEEEQIQDCRENIP